MIPQLIASILLLQVATANPVDYLKIVNGTDAAIKDYPFLVSLRSRTGSHSCGGSILNERWILTAAHCVDYYSTVYYQSVQVGRSDVSREVDESVHFIEDVVIHRHYSPDNSYVNDIALIRLKSSLVFSDTIQPVKLPTIKWSEVNESKPDVTLVGWGRLESDGAMPTRLQQVNYFAVSNDRCNEFHQSHIFPSHICAAVPEGGKGQCSGDSGGPLLHNGVQVGIVSWSVKPCAVAPYPGVLTKVSYFLDWIDENMY